MVTLRCNDQTGGVLELQPGSIASGFRELGSYLFSAPVEGAVLYIDEAPASPVEVDGVQGWRWQPGFYAGQVMAELVSSSGQRVAEYGIDVAPDASKLGAEVFNNMLDELYAFDPALLLGSEAAQTSIGVAGETASPLLYYARLRRHGDALLKALKQVGSHPLSRLRSERAQVPCHRLRRIDPASARGLLRRPQTAAFLRRDVAMVDGASPLFDVLDSTDHLDNPANRALAATLLAVRRRCVQTADALDGMAASEEDAGTRTPLKPRLARRLAFLGGLADQLAKLARISPYGSVTRAEVTVAGLNAISAHPSYARAYRLAWSALRAGVAGDDRVESTWLSPTWEIYERWCFVRVARHLRERYSALAWTIHYPGTKSDNIRLVGTGSAVRIEASLQRTFRPGGVGNGGLRSVSLQLQPDLVITMEAGEKRRMIVLDAKYRTSRQNVLDAMRSAHLYQDALRWDGKRPTCSLLLVPRGGGAPWLEESAFHAAENVGVYVMAPDSPSSEFGAMIDSWLTTNLHA